MIIIDHIFRHRELLFYSENQFKTGFCHQYKQPFADLQKIILNYQLSSKHNDIVLTEGI